MRDYLTTRNLGHALMLASVITAMSIPRIMAGGMPVGLYAVTAMLAMTLICGSATAWGSKARMHGLFPSSKRMLIGAGIAVLLVAMLTPIYHIFIHPILRAALEQTGDARMIDLRYPSTNAGRISLILWTGSFELMFFSVAGMSFFARLTGRQSLAIVMVVLFRLTVSYYQLQVGHITESIPVFLLCSALSSATTCLLFAQAGLPATMIFAMGHNIHLFFTMPL